MEWLENIWAVIGTGVAIFVSINVFFFKSDDFFSKDFKEDVSLQLLCVEPPDSNNTWPDQCIRLFDKLFKKRLRPDQQLPEWRQFLCWRTFLTSVAASFLAITIVALIGMTAGPLTEFESALSEAKGRPSTNVLLNATFFTALIGISFNVIPDYLSLLETRYLMRWLRGRPSTVRFAGVLVVDMVLTTTIFVLIGGLLYWFLVPIFFATEDGIDPTLGQTFLGFSGWIKFILWLEHPGSLSYVSGLIAVAMGVFFYSTFFTSIWLWLFGLSHLVITLASRTGPLLKVVRYVLPIDEKPFRSLGIIAGLIAMFSYWIFATYQWIGATVA